MDQTLHPGETFAERRKYTRYELKLRVNYALQSDQTPVVPQSESITRDLGLGGIALVVNEELKIGQTLQVKIDLPCIADLCSKQGEDEAMSAAEKTVTLVSRVAWCRHHEGRQFLVGVQFLNLEDADAQALKDFLEEYSLQDNLNGSQNT